MSKKYLSLMALAVAFGSCTNDLEEKTNSFIGNGDVVAVTMDDADSRTAMDGNDVVWSKNDAIGIFIGSTNNEYGLQGEGGTTSGNFKSKGLVVASAETLKEAAYFPYVQGATWNSSKKVISTTLPTTYEYAEGTNNNAVMAALMTEDAQSSISFKNAGALYAITVENIPEGYTRAVMTYLGTDDNVGIAGAATITFADGVPTLAVPDADNAVKTITITFKEVSNKTFYFPMPVKDEGYANNLQFSLEGDNVEAIKAPVFTKEPVSGNLYIVTLKLDNVNGGIVSEANDIAAANTELAKDAVTSVAVKDATDTKAITIPAKSTASAAVEHTIDLSGATLPTTGSVEIAVIEGTGEKATVAKLTVIVPEGTSAGSYTINAPGTTVTIQGANGTVIETIEATTAENTLIIGEGVTINKLVLNQGALKIADGATNVTINNIEVKNELGLRSAVAVGKKVALLNNIELTGFDKWLPIENICEIDLNGNSITHEQSTVIKIFAGGKLTIGGEGTVETKDAACGAIGNYGGELIINGGTYKSIEAAAIYCDRVPKDAERKGTWNLEINGGTFITTSQTAVALHNNRKNDKEGYADGMATIKGGTFTGGGDFYDLYLVNVKADIVVDNCTFTNDKVYLLTKGEAIDGDTDTWGSLINEKEMTVENANGMYLVSTETGLRTAVAAGGKVTLIDDITLTGYDEWLSINNDCEIDLNGNSITHAQSTVIKVFAGGKLTIGGKGSVETTDNKCCAISNLGGTLVINGGTYKSKTAAAIYCDRGEGTTWNLTIEDGTFETESQSAVALQNNNGESVDKKGLATIKKGIFTGAVNWHDLYLCNVIADITASNCTFTNNKGVWLQTVNESTSGGTKTYSSVINGTTYTEASTGVANGYILK